MFVVRQEVPATISVFTVVLVSTGTAMARYRMDGFSSITEAVRVTVVEVTEILEADMQFVA